jgi:hypothetical protein
MALALMLAVNRVADTKVVAAGLPFKKTTEPVSKPLPLTVSVKATPACAVAGLRLVSVPGPGVTV